MTIGELFVKLGFKIEGENQLTDVLNRVNTASSAFVKFGEGLTSVSNKLTDVVLHSVSASLALSKFSVTTGLSTSMLQEWQYTAGKFSVSGEEVANTFKNIQNAQAAIALGQGNIAPWQLLGIDPRQNPEEVLMQIHDRIINMREDVARFVTAQMGIGEGMFAVLKDPTMTIGQLHEKFKQTEQDQKNLLKLNEQLEHLKFQLVALSTKFVSAFGDKLEGLLEKLFKIVDQGADFLIWLNSGDKEAQNFKNTLGDVLVILLQIAPAILAIASAVKILTAALGVLSALVGGPLRLLAAAFIAGQALSIARSTDIIEEGTKRGKSIEQIRKENPSVSETESRYGFGGQTGLFESLGHWLIDKFSPTREAMPATNAPTTNNNTFNIQSNDPKAVANEVSSILNVRNSGVNAQLSVYG